MKHRVAWLGSALALSAFVWLYAPEGMRLARASVVQALSLAELVDRAEHIVIARAGERQGRWHYNARMIVTDVVLEVQRTFKGDAQPGERLIATVLGGALDNVGVQVPGAARFETGARAIVFLRKSEPSGDLRVVGMSQGVLPLQPRADGWVVLPGGGGALRVPQAQDDEPHAPLPPIEPSPTARPIADVVEDIVRLVSGDPAPPAKRP